ncbi:MAG: hypothetical protein H7Z73_11620 [Candidatus Saccharibacteria bacterium]|nr:hypothetical protein [Moraxellaceae bacterium]
MRLKAIFAGLTMVAIGTSAQAQTICVFDVLGAQGDTYAMMKDYVVAAKQWDANITLKPYTDERLASEDFKAGQCDGVFLTGMRTRSFNHFTGSLDSIGSIPSYSTLKMALSLMANPKLADEMISNGYEVVGVSPLGAAYIMVRDSSINSLAKAAGKRFGVLDYDKAQGIMVQKVGAQPVSVDLTTVGGKFNNGQVDMIGMPAITFKPFELYKGIGTKGAIIRFPVVQVTGDIIIRPEKFQNGYGQKSRTWILSQLGRGMDSINKVERAIDAHYWLDIAGNDKAGYVKLMREARITLTKQGIYNKKLMSILKKVRCQQDSLSFECALTDE